MATTIIRLTPEQLRAEKEARDRFLEERNAEIQREALRLLMSVRPHTEEI